MIIWMNQQPKILPQLNISGLIIPQPTLEEKPRSLKEKLTQLKIQIGGLMMVHQPDKPLPMTQKFGLNQQLYSETHSENKMVTLLFVKTSNQIEKPQLQEISEHQLLKSSKNLNMKIHGSELNKNISLNIMITNHQDSQVMDSQNHKDNIIVQLEIITHSEEL